jgi:hypothetical protein
VVGVSFPLAEPSSDVLLQPFGPRSRPEVAVTIAEGKTLLVDSGKNSHGKRIKAVMDTAGVSQSDAFVATHYHEDEA